MKNLEKTKLTLGFVPITCATPIIGGHALGFYERYGLDVDIVKTAGWAVSRDKCLNGEYDGSHLLFPMPMAMSLGIGSTAQAWKVVSNVNTNGQAIVLANKHIDNQDPKNWKGFKFAVPFEYSMHNLLLRNYVADAGLDPDRDIQIRVVPPPEMVANLRSENVDGYLAPDPFCQRAVYDQVGFIHKLTLDLWKQHPCCVFGLSEKIHHREPQHHDGADNPRSLRQPRPQKRPMEGWHLRNPWHPPTTSTSRGDPQADPDRRVPRWSGQHQKRAGPDLLHAAANPDHGPHGSSRSSAAGTTSKATPAMRPSPKSW